MTAEPGNLGWTPKVPTRSGGEFNAIVYDNDVDNCQHLALYKGEINPELPVLVTSGWAEPEDVQTALQRGAKRVLRKPYRAAELRSAVSEILAAPRPQEARSARDSGAGWAMAAPPEEGRD